MISYGWPQKLIMRLACQYTGRSRWALARAVRDGELEAAGKNGRSLVFDRDALDSWLVGANDRESAPTIRPRREQARTSPVRTDAISRLRAIARGAR